MKLPSWSKKDLKLPEWAEVLEDHPHAQSGKVGICIEANTEKYLEDWLEILEVKKIDQYWLEVAYQCAKMDLQLAIEGTKYDPRNSGKAAEFHMTNAPDFALKKFPPGKGIEAATQGREAREHYRRIRGRIPLT